MIRHLSQWTNQRITSFNPWTNVYGLVRSIFAFSLFITLFFNDATLLFRPSSGNPTWVKTDTLSMFSFVPETSFALNLIRIICLILLLVVMSGWRPRVTSLFHLYIAYSINSGATTIDGGEQVNLVMALLLLPIALTDNRKWHWQNISSINRHYSKTIAYIAYVFIRIQVAILYFHSFTAKLDNDEWLDGTAVYYYLLDPMLGLPNFLMNPLHFLLASPFIVVITWVTLFIQLLLVCALFMSKNNWSKVLWCAVLFHELIAVLLGLISFSIAMLAMLIIYLRQLEQVFVWQKNKRRK